MATNTLEILIRANDKASGVISGIAKSVSGSMQSAGASMIKSGVMMAGAAAPVVAALSATVGIASDFDESMTNVGAVLGKSKSDMQDLSAQVLAIGAASRAGPQAAAEAFYDIVGGVADASTHMAILEAAIATAEAGSADLGGTTSALISIMNSYGFSADQAAFASDVLTQTVGAGVGSMEEFAAAMPQVAGLASSLGISFDDLGAGMAFLTTKGFSASQSATQLRAMMVTMLNPNEKMKKSLQEAGFASGELAIQQLGLVGAFAALSEESPTFRANMAGALGSVEALNGVISLTDESFAQFADDFVSSAEGATDAARKIQLDSFAAQMDLLNSGLDALKIQVGLALLPALNSIVYAIRPIVTSMAEWAQKNKPLIATVAKVAAGVAAFGAALAGAGALLGAIPILLGVIVSPLGIVAAAVAGLSIALGSLEGDALSNVFHSFKKLVKAFLSFDPEKILRELGSFFVDLVFIFTSGLRNTKIGSIIWDDLSNELQALRQHLQGGGIGIISRAAGMVVTSFIISLANAFPHNWLSDTILNDLQNELKALRTAFNTGIGIGDAFKSLGRAVKNVAGPIISGALRSIFSRKNLDTVLNAVESVGGFILNALLAGIKFTASLLNSIIIQPLITAFNNAGGLIGIGTIILDKIGQGLSAIGNWTNEHIIGPIRDAFSEGGAIRNAGESLLNGLRSGFGSAQELARQNIIMPMKAAFDEGGLIGVGQLILDQIKSGFGPIADWVNNSLINPIRDAFSEGGALREAGENILNRLQEGVNVARNWAMINLVAPMQAAFAEGGWEAVGQLILDRIREGLTNINDWVQSNIIEPISAALTGEEAQSAKEFATRILDRMKEGLGEIHQWVMDNITGPIVNFLSDEEAVQGASGGAGELARKIIEGLVSGIGDLGAWVRENIINKIIDTIKGAAGGGREGGGAQGAGEGLSLNILAGIANTLQDLPGWVYNNVITPFLLGLTGEDSMGGVQDHAGQLGTQLLQGIIDGIGDLASFVLNDIIIPLGTEMIAKAPEVAAYALDIGKQIVQGILDALVGLGQDILDAIKNEIASVGDVELIGGSGISLNNVGRIFGQASGGPVSANTPYIVGERGPELFVPNASGRIVPNHQLGSAGQGGGSQIMNLDGAQIVLPGVTNARQFFDELELEAKRRNRKFAPAMGGRT